MNLENILELRNFLAEGQAIPALPLALDENRQWSQQHQRAVIRYYIDAGVGGIAVGVHSTQFEIRDPEHALFEPVLGLAAESMSEWLAHRDSRPFVRIAGVCGKTEQALREAEIAKSLGYHAALLSVAAFKTEPEEEIIEHCYRVSEVMPIIGFYLQPAVGGRVLSYDFWRKFAEIPNLVAIKMAPFNRYQTFDVVRAVIDSGRDDVSLYTGNDDNIIVDLLTPFEYAGKTRYIAGGLLGQWGVWSKKAVELLEEIKQARKGGKIDISWLTRAAALTDANGIVFDVAHKFAGCIPGIHEVLRRQGIFATNACLNPAEILSSGQAAELDRIARAYPELIDDEFVQAHLSEWLES